MLHRSFFRITLLVALGFGWCVPLGANAAEAALGQRVFESRLSNGLEVILLENHKAPIVTFQVWYRAGARNEPMGKTGLAHLLEHLMFKGTKKISAEEFTRTIQENGGEYNAFTSQDFAGYYETLSADRVQVAIDLEADRMTNLVFKDEDFHTERMVVMEERRMRTEDDPQSFLAEQLDAVAFLTQPYQRPVIGWSNDLARLTLEDAKAYYQAYYNPVNAFIVVAGDFKKEEMLAGIEKAFGVIPESPRPQHYTYQDPPQTGERRVIVEREAQLPSLIIGYHVPTLGDPDSYALEVLATILAGGKSARLYESLVREKRLVLGADASHSLLRIDPDLFYLSATLMPGKTVEEVEKAFSEEIERLQREPVADRELQKAKNQLEAAFVFGQDSIFFQAMLLARYEIAQDWRGIDEYLPAIRKVSAEDIQRVAGRYLLPTNRTTGILKPLPVSNGKPAPMGPPAHKDVVR